MIINLSPNADNMSLSPATFYHHAFQLSILLPLPQPFSNSTIPVGVPKPEHTRHYRGVDWRDMRSDDRPSGRNVRANLTTKRRASLGSGDTEEAVIRVLGYDLVLEHGRNHDTGAGEGNAHGDKNGGDLHFGFLGGFLSMAIPGED